jgi:hypothetical protein
MTVTLSKTNAAYTPGGAFTATNGVWNAGSLVNGQGFTQTISIEEASFPDGVTMNWSWPQAGNGSVYAYPEISWAVSGKVVQIADILTLSTDYDFKIGGQTNGFNVAFDTWLYADPRGIWETTSSEVMLWVHSNGWKPDFESSFADGYLDAGLEIDPDWGDLSGSSPHKWQYIAAINNADKLSGTVSHSNLLKDLIWKGVISGYEYIRTVEVGAETMQGKGSLQVNNLDYNESRKALVNGGAGDDSFVARPVGQNHIIAGAGTDTVTYDGAYAGYELQSRTQDVLVRARGDVSTLDMLEGVEKVRFDDGTYDVASRTFTEGGAPPPATTLVAPAAATPAPTATAPVITQNQSQNVFTGAQSDGTAGVDTIFGGSGADYIRGFEGDDMIEGAAGDDDVNGNQGSDTVYGGEGADWVRGGKDNDFVDGSAGDDPHVNGNLGDDTVRGGIGADSVYGGQGADQLFGDTGDDLLSGDLGNDTLSGGFGADRFVIGKGGGFDWVSDFNAAQGDRIQLAAGTPYSYGVHQGQVIVNLGGGDIIGLTGIPSGAQGDWVVFA